MLQLNQMSYIYVKSQLVRSKECNKTKKKRSHIQAGRQIGEVTCAVQPCLPWTKRLDGKFQTTTDPENLVDLAHNPLNHIDKKTIIKCTNLLCTLLDQIFFLPTLVKMYLKRIRISDLESGLLSAPYLGPIVRIRGTTNHKLQKYVTSYPWNYVTKL